MISAAFIDKVAPKSSVLQNVGGKHLNERIVVYDECIGNGRYHQQLPSICAEKRDIRERSTGTPNGCIECLFNNFDLAPQ